MTESQPTSYEDAFKSLQEIISRLEDGELSLEGSLRLYEEGKKLSDQCAKLLEQAQLRVSTLGEGSQPASEE
mgnify:CR=1 FL=1